MIVVLGLTNRGGDWINGEGWSGGGYHRILTPLGNMPEVEGYVSDAIVPGNKVDILLYNRVSNYDKDWDEIKAYLGCKVVLDLDDYWYPDYYGMAKRIENNITVADMVFVSTYFLASKVRKFNENVIVVPNGLTFGKGQFTDDKVTDEKIRIFWAGGISHETDLQIFRNAVNYKGKLIAYQDKVEMVIGGYNDAANAIWNNMLSSFTLDGRMPNKVLPSMPATHYMEMYKYGDIMVIPLEKKEFNKGKSILKILEAAAKKMPCIVSNVEPYSNYKDAPVLWVNDKKDWIKHLEYLISDENARIEFGNKLHKWAVGKFNLADINKIRFSAFEALVN